MTRVYYNEIDAYCAQWLRNLMAAGHIPQGEVDERSIADVRPDDLRGFSQCHFFAGIGGWPYALRLAGWGDEPVWTGSCPCQPFSAAGKRKGFADERHLWPVWFELIRQCKPAVVFGEQVARAIGRGWLDTVADELESEDYAIGAAVLPACAVSAPHVRERLWFVADACGAKLWDESGRRSGQDRQDAALARAHGATQSMADTDGHERHGRGGLLQVGRVGGTSEAQDNAAPRRIEWPSEPDIPRVADGVPNRVDKLRALGNAIVPQVAAEFIGAYLDCRPVGLSTGV